MKRYLILILLLTAAVVTSNAQSPAPDAAELTKLLNWFLAGTNDPKVHEQFWADDLIYTRSSGVRTNKEEILKGMRSAAPRKESDTVTTYSADDVVIHQYGNVAVVAFKLVIQTKRPDGAVGLTNNLNTGTFMKRNGKWQAIAWQSTVAPIKEDFSKPMVITQPIKPADSSEKFL